jgi:WD40 repeat protein
MSVRVMPIGRALRRLSVALTTAVAALSALSASSALAVTATPTFIPGDFVGIQGSGNGEFQSPGSIAVEPATHNVLVADTLNARVQVLAPSGNGVQYVTSFGTGTLTAPFGLAIDRTSGAVYVTDTDAGTPVIRRYTSDGAATPTYTLDAGFTSPTLVSAASTLAVDPTTHDLVVADTGTQEVKRFAVSDGHLISSFNGSTSGGGQFTSLRSVAVAPSGTVYVVDELYPGSVFLEPGKGRVERFDAAGGPQGALQGMDQPASVTVAGATGTVIVAWDNGFDRSPRHLSLFPGTDVASATVNIPDPDPGLFTGGIVGLAYDETSPHDAFALYDQTFGQFGRPGVQRLLAAEKPGVEIGPANSVGETTAQVTGAVAPGVASGAATIHFEYWLAVGSEQVTEDQVITGPGETAVSANLTGLRPNTTYSVRIVASNDNFSDVRSTVGTFTTGTVAPGVQDGGVTDRTASAVVVNGRVNPYGQQTTYRFEYGETDDYGQVVPIGDEDVAGNGYAFRGVSHGIAGLKPATTYHYRLVAHNASGSSATPDTTFTTRSGVEPVRAYEQVTPVNKGGALLNTFASFYARADGEALIYQTKNAMDLPGVESAPVESRYASRRTDAGWDLRPLDVPQNVVPPAQLLGVSTSAVSSDLSHALVNSNRKLAPGGVEGSGNLYRRDIETGALEFVATGFPYSLISGPSGADIYYGGSPDFSRIALRSSTKLTPDATEGVENMYEWTVGQGLRLISQMPDGSPTGVPVYASRLVWPARNLVTEDGSQIFFSTSGGLADGIYRTQTGVTERILNPGGDAQMVDVTPDGRYVVYVTGPNRDLYRYDTRSDESTPIFTGVSVGSGVGYMGMSADGSSIFTSGDSGADPVVWHNGDTSTIGHAPAGDGITNRGVAVSPNGRYFVFSTTLLEGQTYDNVGCPPVVAGGADLHDRCLEVYVYDVAQHKLTCISCPADGGRSVGHAILGPTQPALNLRIGRYVNDDGEVFFTTATKLVAADTNGSSDVYMYQDGEVQLVSPGKGEHNATLADVSADGSDVFFETDEQLVGQDRDNELDMYDARIGGGIAAQSIRGDEVAPCSGPDCREATAGPTTSPTVASQIASGLPESIVAGAKAKVSVLKVTMTPSSLRAKIRVSGRGQVRLSSRAVATKSVSVSRAGTYTVEAKWTKKTRSARRAKRRVKVAARITLTPPFGAAAVARFHRTLGK